MGLEKILYFISKNGSLNTIEENTFSDDNKYKKIADNIFFDFNFIIYNNLSSLEAEINEIIKIFYCIEHINKKILYKKLLNILNKKYWNICREDVILLFNNNNFNGFKKLLKKQINISYIANIRKEKLVNYLFYYKIYYYIIKKLKQVHYIEFIKCIHLFFDGIPEYSKILEQKRRRTKTYYDSLIKKKLINIYFKQIDKNLVQEGDYIYNYFDWLDNSFNVNKSFGPTTKTIVNLQNFLKHISKNRLLDLKNNNIMIKICGGNIYGESDFKIFKYIYYKKIKGIVYIHTCDTDFLHLILIQQCYAKIFDININFNLIRYYSKKDNDYQIITSDNVLKQFIKVINKYNMDNSYNIILDILFLCYFFGNDYIPENNIFNTNYSFDDIINLLKKSYIDNKKIIYYDKKNVDINWDIFLNILNNMNKSTYKYKFLKKYFNFNNKVITYLNNNNIDIHIFLYSIIPKYLSFLGMNMDNNTSDWRCIYYKKLNNTINPFKDCDNDIIKNINSNLKYTKDDNINQNEIDYMKYNIKYFNLSNENSYQDMYYYILTKINLIGKNTHHLYYKNYIDETEYNIEEYILLLYSFLKRNFINMINYKSYNTLCYSKYISPPIDTIIKYIDNNINKNINLSKKFNNMINDNFMKQNKYFNKEQHHYFISIVTSPKNKDQEKFKKLLEKDYKNIDINWYLNSNSFK